MASLQLHTKDEIPSQIQVSRNLSLIRASRNGSSIESLLVVIDPRACPMTKDSGPSPYRIYSTL